MSIQTQNVAPDEIEKEFLLIGEAARYLEISRSEFDRNVRPHIPHYNFSRRPRFRRCDLDAWRESCRIEPKEEPHADQVQVP